MESALESTRRHGRVATGFVAFVLGVCLLGPGEFAMKSGPAAQPNEDESAVHAYTLPELGLILLTCACAAALNYSGIALIGRINPIAFQFVNQLKTVLIVSVGFLVFAEAADATRVLSVATGLVCVISGIAWYTWHKQTQKKRKHC